MQSNFLSFFLNVHVDNCFFLDSGRLVQSPTPLIFILYKLLDVRWLLGIETIEPTVCSGVSSIKATMLRVTGHGVLKHTDIHTPIVSPEQISFNQYKV